ncbi:hypothetical protein PPERSA_00576 [Pseudocohnilembus persalinus]|uniref:Transmembrane protein n=1 Tax=Pseudocohnilembus persalinus TaxID=266149 RepID=A0A0V0QSZ0_PSEPJ|nr:hypothetical protein PPERSA_00576 [Pseudocohnilembus persalinus]|eukprot:KRX05275.1 hypothetical protein PPERSA_00576 [Pseudocohnilembus persalinus]
MLKIEIQEELASKLGLIANKNENIVVTQVVNKDNQPGLHVTSDKGEFIVHSNLEGEIVVVNTQFVKQKWFKLEETVEEEKEKLKKGKTTRYDERLESIAKSKPLGKYISQGNISSQPGPNLTENATYYGTVSDVGSSLGYCLANIKNYNNPQEFLLEFGYISAMNGSVTYLVQKIPIFGPILLLGGMGWTSLKLYNNKCANGKTKLQQASKLVLNTGTAIGGSISGAFIGQAVIPVPILGALVGGVIGGFMGTQASSMLIQQLNKQKYQKMVQNLEESMEDGGYWKYTRKNLDIFGITNQYFIQEAPKDLKIMYGEKHGEVWMTMLAYCIITLYHSQQEQKDVEKNQEKMKILEEKEKQIILEKSKQNEDLKNEIFKDLKDEKQSFLKKKQEEEEKQILMKKQKEMEKKQKNKKNGHDIFGKEQDSDDESIYWPQTITLPQKWLLNQQVFVGWYIDQISVALKKIMSQG